MMKLFAILLLLFCVSVAGQSCTQCEILATVVKSFVNNNASVQTIEKAVLQYCTLFPGTEKDQCTTFVQKSFAEVVKLVNKYDNPSQVCQILGYCSSTKALLKPVASAESCPICEYLVGLAETWLTENATEQRIFNLFESACNILPGDSKYVCRAAVEQYGKVLIQLLVNKEDPEKICELLSLCTPTKLQAKGDPVPCYLCKYLIQSLEAFATENTTEAELVALADKICSILPSSLSSSCQSLVDNYIPQVIQYIIAKEDPGTVCAAISLCSSSSRLVNRPQTVKIVQKLPADAQTCQLCQFLFLTIDGYLSSNTTQQNLIKYVDEICAKLGAFQATCEALVAQELPTFIKYIISKAEPVTACTELGVCPASARKQMAKISRQRISAALNKKK